MLENDVDFIGTDGTVKESNIKICHITYSFPPAKGGTETHNHSLVSYLTQKGYDVDVIVVRDQSESKKEVDEAANTINKNLKVHNIWYSGFPSWVFKVRKKIKEIEKEGKIDVFDIHLNNDIFTFLFHKRTLLHSLHFFEMNCPGPLPERWPRPCIFSFRKCIKCCGIRNYLEWKFIRWFNLRKVTKFIAKYDYLKNISIKIGVEKERVSVVPHWIDIERINRESKGKKALIKNIKPSDYVFMFFGRLTDEKGPDLLLDAFYNFTKEKQNTKLVFIGDGTLRKELEKTCEKYNISDKVIFLGMIPNKELFRYLSLANIIVFPHRYFNYEWALLEAMCTEKPIIATDMPATSDILKDNFNALLAEATSKSLTSKMLTAIENPKLCETLSKNALKTVKEKHGFENLKRYEELIKGLKT